MYQPRTPSEIEEEALDYLASVRGQSREKINSLISELVLLKNDFLKIELPNSIRDLTVKEEVVVLMVINKFGYKQYRAKCLALNLVDGGLDSWTH